MHTNLDTFLMGIAAGDADVFGRFVAAAEPSVRGCLRSFARHVDTEAVVQEAFLRTWQIAPRFVPDGKPNGLLRLTARIARNLAVSETRKARAQPFQDETDSSGDSIEVIEQDPLLRKVILLCLEKLTGPTRMALGARLENGGTEPDAVLATRIGMRPNTFLQNVSRARKLVADCLEGQGVYLSSTSVARTSTEAP